MSAFRMTLDAILFFGIQNLDFRSGIQIAFKNQTGRLDKTDHSKTELLENLNPKCLAFECFWNLNAGYSDFHCKFYFHSSAV